jgi:hypothetical protein
VLDTATIRDNGDFFDGLAAQSLAIAVSLLIVVGQLVILGVAEQLVVVGHSSPQRRHDWYSSTEPWSLMPRSGMSSARRSNMSAA